MFQSKFNLYNVEWLDVVFSERNKNYGAYELRKHYNSNLLKALLITATLFSAGLFSASYLLPLGLSQSKEVLESYSITKY